MYRRLRFLLRRSGGLKRYCLNPQNTIPDRKPAILIFSRTAEEEAAAKGLHRIAGRKGAVRLARHLIRHTQRQAARTGLPVITRMSGAQQGSSFGERLAGAVAQVFSLGFTEVIVTGTDHPKIHCSDFLSMHRLLQSAPLAAMPAEDGGIALLALRREAFAAGSLASLPWGTSHLCSAFQLWAESLQQELLLSGSTQDLDESSAFLLYLLQHPGDFLSLLLREVMDAWKKSFRAFIQGSFHTPSAACFLLRGPPLR